VSLDEITDKSKRLKPAVSLTFDDGYRDVLKVKGFLKENNIPATIFVLSDPKSVNREELDNDRELLSIHEVKKLKDEGWTIGCHSATHANFLELDKTAVQKEIYTAKANLEKAIGTEIKYFAYPKGVNSRKLQNAVNNAGYFAAFTANPGIVEKSTNIFALPRFVMEKKNIFQIPYSFTEIVDQFRKARGITYAN
jgi:peptidoglycan/xylan/chitin deacetylase (PgdA/CDA1 family)